MLWLSCQYHWLYYAYIHLLPNPLHKALKTWYAQLSLIVCFNQYQIAATFIHAIWHKWASLLMYFPRNLSWEPCLGFCYPYTESQTILPMNNFVLNTLLSDQVNKAKQRRSKEAKYWHETMLRLPWWWSLHAARWRHRRRSAAVALQILVKISRHFSTTSKPSAI